MHMSVVSKSVTVEMIGISQGQHCNFSTGPARMEKQRSKCFTLNADTIIVVKNNLCSAVNLHNALQTVRQVSCSDELFLIFC